MGISCGVSRTIKIDPIYEVLKVVVGSNLVPLEPLTSCSQELHDAKTLEIVIICINFLFKFNNLII